MKPINFWSGLVIISVIMTGLILWANSVEVLMPYTGLSVLSLCFMVVTTVTMYFLAKLALNSTNQYAFIQLVIASVLAKIVLALALNMVYVKVMKPEGKYFILPFIIMYIIYTIFETYALFKMSLKKPIIDHE